MRDPHTKALIEHIPLPDTTVVKFSQRSISSFYAKLLTDKQRELLYYITYLAEVINKLPAKNKIAF